MPPGRWIRENLFSSVSNGIQTVVFAAILIGLMRWLLGIIFADESDWTSVGTNMRLLMSYNYPAEQYVRIWFTVGAVAAATGLSFAAWNLNPSVTFRRLGVGLIGSGAVLLVVGVITPSTTPTSFRVGSSSSAPCCWSPGSPSPSWCPTPTSGASRSPRC